MSVVVVVVVYVAMTTQVRQAQLVLVAHLPAKAGDNKAITK